jgi:hypothetical protein
MKKAMIVLLTAATILAATPAMAASKFSDVKDTDWSAPSINFMVDKKVLSGYPDGTFKPGNQVTKAEFAHMYHALFPDVGSKATTTSEFEDVKDHWASKDFAALFSGYNSWQFADHFDKNEKPYLAPDKQLTRWDVMMLVGLLTKEIHGPRDANGNSTVTLEEVLSTLAKYTDIKIRPAEGMEVLSLYTPIILTYNDGYGVSFFGDVENMKADLLYAATTLGVMVGDAGKFRPSDKVTRAEAVAILHRIYTDLVNK